MIKKKTQNFEKPYAKLIVTSENPQDLETFMQNTLTACKKLGYKLKGPISIPSASLNIHRRNSPGGKGSGTICKLRKTIARKILYIYNKNIFTYLLYNLNTASYNIEPQLILI